MEKGISKNNERPAWLSKQKSTKTYFYERLEEISANNSDNPLNNPSWKKEAFFEIFELLESGIKRIPSGELSKKYGIRIEYLSRWIHSQEFEELVLIWSRVKYLSLLPKAIFTVDDMLANGAVSSKKKEDKIRYQVAKDIIEKAEIFKEEIALPSDKPQGNTINIFNLSENELMKKIKEKQNRILEITGRIKDKDNQEKDI